MKNPIAIIIGGTGQYGITVGKQLLKKKYRVYITTRLQKKKTKFKKKYSKINFLQLNIYNKEEIKKILISIKPDILFYFAGQSSPQISFLKKKKTFKSNLYGCKNILETIHKYNINCKFLNATSSEMYGKIHSKIKLSSTKKPVNPYGKAKKLSFNLVKKYREKYKLKTYNAIIFNTESYLREKNFLIPKICLAAIKAYKYGKKTSFNNILVSREWNWCDEQSNYLIKFLNKKPQDFILSNGKCFSIKQMLKFAFQKFNLDYQNFITVKNQSLKKNEIRIKKSDYLSCLKRNKIKRKNVIYGEKIILKLIKYYLNEK